jgi:hypothetical protein
MCVMKIDVALRKTNIKMQQNEKQRYKIAITTQMIDFGVICKRLPYSQLLTLNKTR